MCTCVTVHVCASAHVLCTFVYVESRSKPPGLGAVHIVFQDGTSHWPRTFGSPGLAGQRASETCLSLPPQCRDYKVMA